MVKFIADQFEFYCDRSGTEIYTHRLSYYSCGQAKIARFDTAAIKSASCQILARKDSKN
jgi:hypothetical protein